MGAYTFKTAVDEDPNIIEFIKMQSNRNDVFRYLIEKEIHENGLRNLQNFIPSKRTAEYFDSIKSSSIPTIRTINNEEVSITKEAITEQSQDIKNSIEDNEITDYNMDKVDKITDIEDNDSEYNDVEIPDCYQ